MPRDSYRYILLIAICLCITSRVYAQDIQPKPIFNGTDLTGWKGDASRWTVENGAITGRTTAENPLKYNTFLIWEGGQPSDFELHLKYKIVAGNSGVQYRSRIIDEERFIISGYQADIDSKPVYTALLYEEKGRGILVKRGEKAKITRDGKTDLIGSFGDSDALQGLVRNEDWNEYRIVARGNRLRHFINGKLMTEAIDQQTDKAATSGLIAFQVHQGPPMTVQFKDITLRELK